MAGCFAHLRRRREAARFAIEESDPSLALAELTRIGAEHSPLLCMHAGVVAGAYCMLVVPGHSGLGKTTLVAALVQRGFGYVSDECLAVDLVTGLVEPFARPLGLAAPAWPVLGLDSRTPPSAPGGEKLIRPDVFGAVAASQGRVHDIVLARREPGEVCVARSPRGAAVSALLQRSLKHDRAGGELPRRRGPGARSHGVAGATRTPRTSPPRLPR